MIINGEKMPNAAAIKPIPMATLSLVAGGAACVLVPPYRRRAAARRPAAGRGRDIVRGGWRSPAAEAKRSAGLLGEQLVDRGAANQAGMSALTSRIGRGWVSVMRRRTPKLVSARKGGRPVHIAYSTLPRLNKSLRASMESPRACSGDM